MPKYKITIEYDGTNFVGWQKQDNGPSIQSSIENAIKKISSETVNLYGAGRTDSGVHAKGQVAHFELSNKISLDKGLVLLENNTYNIKNLEMKVSLSILKSFI